MDTVILKLLAIINKFVAITLWLGYLVIRSKTSCMRSLWTKEIPDQKASMNKDRIQQQRITMLKIA